MPFISPFPWFNPSGVATSSDWLAGDTGNLPRTDPFPDIPIVPRGAGPVQPPTPTPIEPIPGSSIPTTICSYVPPALGGQGYTICVDQGGTSTFYWDDGTVTWFPPARGGSIQPNQPTPLIPDRDPNSIPWRERIRRGIRAKPAEPSPPGGGAPPERPTPPQPGRPPGTILRGIGGGLAGAQLALSAASALYQAAATIENCLQLIAAITSTAYALYMFFTGLGQQYLAMIRSLRNATQNCDLSDSCRAKLRRILKGLAQAALDADQAAQLAYQLWLWALRYSCNSGSEGGQGAQVPLGPRNQLNSLLEAVEQSRELLGRWGGTIAQFEKDCACVISLPPVGGLPHARPVPIGGGPPGGGDN